MAWELAARLVTFKWKQLTWMLRAREAVGAEAVAAARDDQRSSFVLEADGAAHRVSNDVRRDDALPGRRLVGVAGEGRRDARGDQ